MHWFVILLAALVLAGSAAADGDPASDVLLVRDAFVPYPPPSPAAQAALASAIDAVYARNDRVKVAVIESTSDMGSIPSLFGDPQGYAKFLSQELAFMYRGPLLIAMPAGFGFYDNGSPTDAANAVLAKQHPSDSSANGLTNTAATTVSALEQAGTLHFKDARAPTFIPFSATGKRGRPLQLRYDLVDDSGRAAATITVATTQGVVVATFHVPLRGGAYDGPVQSVVWKVPAKLTGRVFAFCGRGTDRSGNRGAQSCAKLTISH